MSDHSLPRNIRARIQGRCIEDSTDEPRIPIRASYGVYNGAYEEGEEDLADNEDGEDPELAALAAERDEKTILVEQEDMPARRESTIQRGDVGTRVISTNSSCDNSIDDA